MQDSSTSAPLPHEDLSLLRNLRDSILAGTHPLFRVPARLYPLPVKTTISSPEQPEAVGAAVQETVEPPQRGESGPAAEMMVLDGPDASRAASDAPTGMEDGEEEEGELTGSEPIKAEQPQANEIRQPRSEDLPTNASVPDPAATAPVPAAAVEVLILDDDDDDDEDGDEELQGNIAAKQDQEMSDLNDPPHAASAVPAPEASRDHAALTADMADDASLPDYVDSDEDDDDFDPSILVTRTTAAPATDLIEELLILDDGDDDEEVETGAVARPMLADDHDVDDATKATMRSPSPSGVNPQSTTSPVPVNDADTMTKESSLPPAQRHATSLSLRLKLEKERLAAAEARLAAAKEATASRDASPAVVAQEPATTAQAHGEVIPVSDAAYPIPSETASQEQLPPTPSSDVVIVDVSSAASLPPPRPAKAASPAPSSGSTVSRQSTATTTSTRPVGNAGKRPSSGSATAAPAKDDVRKRPRADPAPPRARQSRGRSRSISPRRDLRGPPHPPRGRPIDSNMSRGPPPPSHTAHRRQLSGDEGRDDRRPFGMERARSPPRHYLDRSGPLPMGRPYSPPPPHMRGGRYSPSPPRRSLSPPPLRRPLSPFRRPLSPLRRPMSPPRRPFSPPRYPLSPPRRALSPPRRPMSPPRRPLSPLPRPLTPPGFRQYGGPVGPGSFDARSRRSPSPPPDFGPPPGMYRDDLDRRPAERFERFERYDGPGDLGRPRSPPASFYAERVPPAMPPTGRDFPPPLPPMPPYAQSRPPSETYSSRPRSPPMPPPHSMGFHRPMSPLPPARSQQSAFEGYDNRPLAPYPSSGPVWIDRDERDRQDRDRRFDPSMPPPPQVRGGMMQPSYLPQQSAPMVPPPPPPGYPTMYGTPPMPAEFERFHRASDDFARGPPPPPPARQGGPPHQGSMPPPGRRMPMPMPPPPGARR